MLLMLFASVNIALKTNTEFISLLGLKTKSSAGYKL